jgi:hypothetical protein
MLGLAKRVKAKILLTSTSEVSGYVGVSHFLIPVHQIQNDPT